jgi:hypothetical protein
LSLKCKAFEDQGQFKCQVVGLSKVKMTTHIFNFCLNCPSPFKYFPRLYSINNSHKIEATPTPIFVSLSSCARHSEENNVCFCQSVLERIASSHVRYIYSVIIDCIRFTPPAVVCVRSTRQLSFHIQETIFWSSETIL